MSRHRCNESEFPDTVCGALMRKEFEPDPARPPTRDVADRPADSAVAAVRLRAERDVSNLRLGIMDDSRTPESRELVAVYDREQELPRWPGMFSPSTTMEAAISRSRPGCGPRDSLRLRPRHAARPARRPCKSLLNAMNANTAAIAQGLCTRSHLQTYNPICADAVFSCK